MIHLGNVGQYVMELKAGGAWTATATCKDLAIAPASGFIRNWFFAISAVGTTEAVACAVDIHKNGTTIFSSKPSIANSTGTITQGTLTTNPTTVSAGDVFTLDLDTVGHGPTGVACLIVVDRVPTAKATNESDLSKL